MADAARVDRIRGEQARRLYRDCPTGVVFAGLGASLLAFGLVRGGMFEPRLAWLWIGLMWGCVALHLLLCFAYWRARPADSDWRRWLWPFCAMAFVEGMTWLAGALWMAAPDSTTQQLIVLLVYVAIASGGLVVFGTYLPAYLLFLYPTIAPHFAIAIGARFPLHELLAALVATYLVMMTVVASRANRQLTESLRLSFENIDLVEDLRLQKERADNANLAKSRFLASASHDLRQPIHALGLFIGALRGRKMDAEARRLVDHIDGSVGAMDDLFAALLDISKLDAGVVEARIEPLALGPLLARLCREQEGEASRKGIALRHVPTSAVVESDPVLLERVIRNLLSNAVRHSEGGRVLAGCRRAGAAVSIEICDQGPGIAAADRERIFEEFYQTGNPERDREKGLGLGLAIVRRTLPLIGCALSLDSAVGKGSRFRLTVPRAREGAAIPDVAPGQPPDPGEGGLIAVIDDERAIREAMAALLGSWGHRVVTGASAAELAGAGRDDDPPRLLICDYRLRDGATGIDAIRDLRAFFGRDIPAMLVTGDTAPNRIAEAQASGFLLLHKPVPNARLRAAIGNLLRES